MGDFKNVGREWRRRGEPQEVRVHDFLDKTLGKAIPYGVTDVAHNEGWVSVGIDHDTARFAAEAIRRGWKKMGSKRDPNATELLITAGGDGGGGGRNGSRPKLVEGGPANVGRPDWLNVAGVSCPAGYQQVEQD